MSPRRFVATIKRCRPDADLSADQLPDDRRAVCARGVDEEGWDGWMTSHEGAGFDLDD